MTKRLLLLLLPLSCGVEPVAPVAPTIEEAPPVSLPTVRTFQVEADEEPAPGSETSPITLTASDGTGLALKKLSVQGVVAAPLAFTELKMVFENPQNRIREGRFRIVLPDDASISRFAMKIGKRWQEGEVVERQAARVAYEDFLHRRQDPALLEQQAGNEFSARVFPIPARGRKELILSYAQELDDIEAPFVVPLRGLPKIEKLEVRIAVGNAKDKRNIVTLNKENWIPDRDVEAEVRGTESLGLRSDNLVVARVRPVIESQQQEVDSLLLLLDTSASRALGFSRQIRLIQRLVDGLARGAGPSTPLAIVCFDQSVSLLFDGEAGSFDSSVAQAIRERRALGASDLHGVLTWSSDFLGRSERFSRVVLLSDGVVTAGKKDGLTELVKRLPGVERLDAVMYGGIREEALLRRLVTAGLLHDGVAIDGDKGLLEITRRLNQATTKEIAVSVPGANWVWPTTIRGAQAGDETLIYADLPVDEPFTVQVGDRILSGDLNAVERPLLLRASVKARIDRLTDKLDDDDPDLKEAIEAQITKLSVKHRVLSPYTALLVLETEADYRRFQIDRNALTDILIIKKDRLDVLRRRNGPLPHGGRDNLDRLGQVGQGRFGTVDSGVLGLLRGSAIGDAAGFGGLGLRGKGAGGGGSVFGAGLGTGINNAVGSLRGSSLGIGGGHGQSEGRFGKIDLGGRGRSAVRVVPSRIVVRGSLNKSLIGRVMRRNMPRFKYCYERELGRNPNLAGRVVITYTITSSGTVSHAQIKETSMNSEAVESRLLQVVRSLRFPKPAGGGIVIVNYPFVFSRVDDRPMEGTPTPKRFRQVQRLLNKGKRAEAQARALSWREEEPGDVLALLALGESFAAAGDLSSAARAYGSLIDLFPSRADLLRHAGQRLASLDTRPALDLALDAFEQAREQRPDHPASHRLLALAQLKRGDAALAFRTLERGLDRRYPPGRFAGVRRIMREDLGLAAAALLKMDPTQKESVERVLKKQNVSLPRHPTLRFVLHWETDANDVDLHIHDRKKNHAYYSEKELASGGRLYADVTTGYGPECFTIPGRGKAYPYRLQAHYYRRGPMGYGMGTLQIIQHDGAGNLRFEERPYVATKNGEYVELGVLRRPLTSKRLASR